MPQHTKQIGFLGRSAQVAASSYNETDNTIEVVFATDTPVARSTWDGTYNEVLRIDEQAMRMERINSGAPVLNNHRTYAGVDMQLGKVERAWIEDGVAKAILRFSNREDVKPIIQDIRDGIITNVSVGYRVYKYEEKAANIHSDNIATNATGYGNTANIAHNYDLSACDVATCGIVKHFAVCDCIFHLNQIICWKMLFFSYYGND